MATSADWIEYHTSGVIVCDDYDDIREIVVLESSHEEVSRQGFK